MYKYKQIKLKCKDFKLFILEEAENPPALAGG